jgi:CRISPR-associated protein Csb1
VSQPINLAELRQAVQTAAAFRCRSRLQPAGGEGDKVFPPTYAGAVYAMEMRRIEGYSELVRCVLLDSVQSQANRAEEAIQDAVDEGRIRIPVVAVDFSGIPIVEPGSNEPGLYEPIGRVTSLEAPHRIADAILRDSEINGIPFRNTAEGKKIIMATQRNATPLFELCPTALLYGIWDSTGPKGGLGVKFQRAIVSEIIGIDAALGVKTSSRMDPLGIQLKAGPIFQAADGTWTTDETRAKLDKKKPVLAGKEGKPSEVNHGNIAPSLSDTGRDPLGKEGERVYLAGGVTIAYAEQTAVLSLPALRRLRFPLDATGTIDSETNLAAQTVLAALGLCGAVLAAERGLDLRSRCLLCVTEKPTWELLSGRGDTPRTFELTAEQAIQLLNEAIDAAKAKKLPWRGEQLNLRPADKLVDLVRKSQELAVKSGAEDGADE